MNLRQDSQTGLNSVKELLCDGRSLEFDRRVKQLRTGTPSRQKRAAAGLVEFGNSAVEPLCHALGDSNDRVKAAAARALGEIGDPAAVRPLMTALKKSLAGGSGRRHALLLTLPWLLAVLGLGLWLSLFAVGYLQAASAAIAICNVLKVVIEFSTWRLDRGEFHRAVGEALATLAEREALPQLREVLPDLQALAKGAQKETATRRAIADAAARIDRLTAEFRSLPIAAEPAELSADQLPRVKVETQLIPRSLPQPAEGERSEFRGY